MSPGVGIVGCGRVGIEWHLPDIRSAGGTVVALADSVAGRAARFARAHDVPRGYDNARDLVRDPLVDIVAICTPAASYRETAMAALAEGKPVYLEKPPSMNAAEMAEILTAARSAGAILFSGSNQVHLPENQMLRGWIREGRLGEIYLVEASKLLHHNVPKGWHRLRAVGGGGVGMNSLPHRIDLALFLLDSPPVASVTARTWNHFAGMTAGLEGYLVRDVEEGTAPGMPPADVEDTVVALVHFETGASLVLRDAAMANLPDQWSFRLYGTRAGATLQPLALHEHSGDSLVETRPEVACGPKGAHVLAYQELFRCVRERIASYEAGERSLLLMRIIDAIYRSAAQGGREVQPVV